MNIFFKNKFLFGFFILVVVFLVIGIVWAYNAGTNISVTTSAVSQPGCYSGAYPTPTLSWIIGFDPTNPIYPTGSSQIRYEVEIDDDSNFGSINIDTGQVVSGASSYTVNQSGLSFGTSYYWRIRVMDNFSSWTDWASGLDTIFTTNGICNSPPTATSLSVVKGNYCTIPSHYFSWTYSDLDGDPQSRFDFQVDNNNDFSSPELNRTFNTAAVDQSAIVSVPTIVDQLNYNTTYYWRVKVYDTITDSGWVDGTSFTTDKHEYPTIDFSWLPTNPSIDESTIFTDLSTVFGGSTKSAWSWTFEDGNPASSAVQNITTQFTSTGSKQVTLQVTDSDTYSCSESKTINIQDALPEWEEN